MVSTKFILDVSRTNEGFPIRDSIYLATIPVLPLAVYTPNANREIPAAAAATLSQSEINALKPVPKTAPAVLMDSITVVRFSEAKVHK